MEEALEHLCEDLRAAPSAREKIALLDACPQVRDFLNRTPDLNGYLVELPPEIEWRPNN